MYPLIRDYDRPILFNKAGVVHSEPLTAAYTSQTSKIQQLPSAPSAGSPAAPKLRTNFPETWLWQSIMLDAYVFSSIFRYSAYFVRHQVTTLCPFFAFSLLAWPQFFFLNIFLLFIHTFAAIAPTERLHWKKMCPIQ